MAAAGGKSSQLPYRIALERRRPSGHDESMHLSHTRRLERSGPRFQLDDVLTGGLAVAIACVLVYVVFLGAVLVTGL